MPDANQNGLKQIPAKLPIKKLLAVGFYALIAFFLFLYLRTIDLSRLSEAHFSWQYVFIASLLGLAFRYWGAFIWLVLLKGLGAQELNNKTELFYVYSKAWLGRYIPGTVPWILGKIYFASQHGISKSKLAVTALLEGALQIVVLLALSFLMLAFDSRLDVISGQIKVLMIGLLIVCAVAMIPAVFNRLMSVAYKIVSKKTLAREHMASGKTIMVGAVLYAFGAVIGGASLFFIAKSVYPELGYDNLLFIMGAGNLAAAVGMLVIFAPSGIGVREGIQLVLLSIIMPTELALLITVITRLWGVAIDFVFFGFGWLGHRLKPGSHPH